MCWLVTHSGRIALGSSGWSENEVANADLAELIIFCGVLDDADRLDVFYYLKEKYFPGYLNQTSCM